MNLTTVVAAGTPVALVAGLLSFIFLTADNCQQAGSGGISDAVEVAGFTGDQLQNADTIINVGASLEATSRAQMIALMVAITESDLHNTDNGQWGGLFQQKASVAGRMMPATASTTFYKSLFAVDGWESLKLTIAANSVQGGENPFYYEGAEAGATALLVAGGHANPACVTGDPGEVNNQGWAAPVSGKISSVFGPRPRPCSTCSKDHAGLDISAPLKTPIYAANAGKVVATGPNGTYGNWVKIDHGNGIETVYAHMYAGGIHVAVGDAVTAGELIAEVGCAGACTGAHLHFEVRVDGKKIDPLPFMRERGVSFA